MKKLFYSCALCLLSLSIASTTIAASIPDSQSVPAKNLMQQEKSNASALHEQGKYEESFEIFSRLLREYPTDASINLGYARTAIRIGKYGQAVMAYERLLAMYPDEPVLLKELAYALSIQNDEQRATMELGKNKDSTPEENAELAKKWNKQHSRTQISGKLSAGMIYDSNVNNGPASNKLSIGKFDFTFENAKAKDTLAGYLGAQVDAGYRLGTASPWWLVGSANVFTRYNTNQDLYDMKLSSSEFGSGSAGVRYLGAKTMLDVRAKAQIFDYAFEQNVFAVGPDASFIYAVTPKVHLITRANIDSRSYSNNQDYNGWYGSAGQYLRLFMGEAGHNVTVGGRYFNGNTDKDYNSYDGFETNLDFMFVLPFYEIRLSPYIAYSEEYYHGSATVLDIENRFDQRFRLGMNVNIPIDEAWSVDLGYQFMNNNSNSELYTYNQHVINTGVSWSF